MTREQPRFFFIIILVDPINICYACYDEALLAETFLTVMGQSRRVVLLSQK